ncbi:MalY/PatB family protein [Oceanispirochaeta sp.]|jgi:cystathionine beta-lyase|uniref:MalY/PatB family protein n=1 Tax=Oceanispirochaeta sp. TaxID=2035350 RepID=UPI00261599D9|nr:MalY/PatB family protein [Oceanispirochaeta sp.]MDA3958307.1 pyridoxal phosphate-dependent aminotransferase [Oceanispirochaeta sp.]
MDFDRIIDRKGSNAAKWDSKVLKARFGDENMLPFWVADMDFASPPIVGETLKERADHGIFGYPATSKHFLKAWQDWAITEHNWKVPLSKVCFTPGIVGAMSLAVHLFSKPGDSVIIQEPVYQPFRNMIVRNNRRPLVNELKLESGRYVMNFNDLEEKVSSRDCSLMLLCSPHNPGGRVWNCKELGELSRICIKYGVFVVSDEIHADLVLGEKRHIPFSSLSDECAANTMTLMAPSKTFNIAGEKLSVAVFGSQERQKTYSDAQLAFSSEEGSALALAIGEAVYKDGSEWLFALKRYLRENVLLIENFLEKELPRVKMMKPDAGFIGWLDFRGLGLSHREIEDRFLNIGKIAMLDGHWFGQGGEGFFRLNFGCPRSLLKEGLERISASLSDHFVH